MNKRRARREAYFIAAEWLSSCLASCDTKPTQYTDEDWQRIVGELYWLADSLAARGWVEAAEAEGPKELP